MEHTQKQLGPRSSPPRPAGGRTLGSLGFGRGSPILGTAPYGGGGTPPIREPGGAGRSARVYGGESGKRTGHLTSLTRSATVKS